MKKIKQLFAAALLLCSAGAWAQTDVTSSVGTGTSDWIGATATYMPRTLNVQMVERYSSDLTAVGTTVFTQTVTSLSEGTYNVVLYATANNARNDSGIKSDANDLVYVYAGSDKSHKAYVQSHYKDAVVMPHIYSLNNVTVGADGNLEIGMYVEKSGTQWQTIQIKSLTKVDVAAEPDVTKKVTVGGDAVSNTDAFTSIAATSTLEVAATAYVPIYFTNATEAFTYTPETTCTVRFVRTGGSIYVYEGTNYKGTVSTYTPILFTTFDANYRPNDSNQLLQNADFDVKGDALSGDNAWKVGTPWTSNVSWGTSNSGVRVRNNNNKVVFLWRGTQNNKYFGQPLNNLKPNTKYQVMLEQIDAGNSNATFYIGIGSTAGTHGLCETNVKLGTNQNGIKTVSFTTPASIIEGTTYYFTFQNTVSYNSASSGNDPVTQIDWISMEEPYSWGLTGISSAAYLDGKAYIPYTLSEIRAIFEEVYSSIATTLENSDYVNVTGSERTALETAKNTTYNNYTSESVYDYETAINAINGLLTTFTTAKPAYVKFDAEKDRALAIGVVVDDIVRPVSGSDSDLETAIHALYVLEDVATNSGYTIDATDIFGSWTQQNTATNSGQHWSGDNGRSYIDKWDGNGFTMSVTNTVELPVGRYVFKAAARAALGGVWDDALTMQVTGQPNAIFNPQGDSGKGIDTSGAVNYGDGTFANNNGRGWEWRFIPFTLDEPSSVTMKVEAIVKGGNWASFSDITLLTTEDNIGICQMLWSDAKDAAEVVCDNDDYSIITGKERTDLENAISATGTEPNTSAGYQTQTAALNSTKEIFIAAKGTYEEYAQESFIANSLGVNVPAINSSTTTAATLISNMQTMNVSNYEAANTNYTYDATSLLGAWTNAPGYNHGESWNGTTGDGSDEYYDLYNSGARAMTQTTTLPKAKYVLIAKGRASVNGRLTLTDGTNTVTFPHKSSTGKGITTTGDANFGEGTYANEDNGRGWEYRFLTFESDGNAATTLTFNWTTADYNWAGLDDITLLAIPETVTMKETEDYTPVNSIADVALTRTIKGEGTWNTFVVPFDITNEELKDAFGNDVAVAEFSDEGENASAVTINFDIMNTPAITANTPVLLKGNAGTEFTFTGKLIKTGEANVSGKYLDFVGAYDAETTILSGDYYIGSNKLYKSNGFATIKGTRAYLHATSAGVKAINFFIDGDDDPTGILTIDNEQLTIGNEIYNVAGQRMSKMQKGINIVNGKKVLK